MGKPFENANYNLILLVMIVLAIAGMYWLVASDIKAGLIYSILFVIGVSTYLITLFFIREESKEFNFVIPVQRSEFAAVFWFFIGIGSLLLLLVLSNVFDLNIYNTQAFAPFNSFSLSDGATFSALVAQNSPFWTYFVVAITAPIIEEFVLGFLFMFIGMLIASAVRKWIGIDIRYNKMFDFVFALVLGVLAFASLHLFNGTYVNPDGTANLSKLAFAGGFRLIMNLLIFGFGMYKFGLGLMFGIGFHMANNHVALGKQVVIEGLLSTQGIVILVLFVLILIYFIRKLPDLFNGEEKVFTVQD